jgi:RimJ/RimL family protein N-acetyltransferase
MTPGPYQSKEEFVEGFIDGMTNSYLEMFTFAIVDKTRPATPEDDEGALAGMVSYMFTSTTHLSTEMGFLIILPSFQRTHVTTNAVGLMLQNAFTPAEKGGLGMQRVVWQASTANDASIRAAERLGFRREGVLRWNRLNRNGKPKFKVGNGRHPPAGTGLNDVWRDTVVLGLCWDDWKSGAAKRIREAMGRLA